MPKLNNSLGKSEFERAAHITRGPAADPDWKLVLASASPRRHELIEHLRLPYEIVPSTFEESFHESMVPSDLVGTMALEKAREVFSRLIRARTASFAVLGADTMVFLDGKLLGKPNDAIDAEKMLSRLSSKCHEVYTGVALLLSQPGRSEPEIHTAVEVSKVYFRAISSPEIRNYVATGEPMDKAGSYALQGTGSAFVERIDGCYTNIIGLPIPKVVALLRESGIPVLGQCQI